MRPSPASELRCPQCRAVFRGADVLTAPSPFDPDSELRACPQCRQCEEPLRLLCDAPDCHREAGCGWPSPKGYRWTCWQHQEA